MVESDASKLGWKAICPGVYTDRGQVDIKEGWISHQLFVAQGNVSGLAVHSEEQD